jgi:protein-disulfide isomerase
MYVKTGVVRLGYLHFAFLGPESGWAAEASECADDQGKFWEYHDKLFASQAGENQGTFIRGNLKKFAADLKLNTDTFNACLDSGKYASVVEQETSFLESLGVQSTPTFLLNATPIAGALPFEQFQQMIETEKAKKK